MKILILIIVGLSFWIKNTVAQDTIHLNPKVEYYSKNGELFDKLNNSKVLSKYSSCEKIQVSNDSFKIEYCYYIDNKRIPLSGTDYFKIVHDSILIKDNESWCFKKLSDNVYRVNKQTDGFIEKGTSYSIIPFVKNGDFFHMNNQNDTLLIEHFKMGYYICTTIPKIVFKDTIYSEVDEMPKFPSKYGDLQSYIEKRLIFPAIYNESSISGKVYVKTVVMANGKIKIIEVIRSVDPPLDNEALKVISKLPEFEPGKNKGKEVNVYYTIPVSFILR